VQRSSLIEGYRRTGDRHIADAILACMLAKIAITRTAPDGGGYGPLQRAAYWRLIVWCRACNHQVEPNPAAMAERYGADTAVCDWHKRLICSRCGGREVDFVLTGARR
jgi:hypothetical protein